nr:retrovirus-related Pol polyprotein from transposon TNT 1-94 [Tanacetum cinerariifolium]
MQTQTSNALHNAIMEAGGKDRPPMLAPGNYIQWNSRIKRYIDTKPNNELIHYCLQNPPYKFKWTEKTVPLAEGSSKTTTEGYIKNYKNVSQDIRDQLNAKAEAIQIILTGIDNNIYSTVDACPNACKIWKAIERLKQGESINVQDLETNLYWEFGKFTSQDGESLESYYSRFYKMMNELVRNQCDVTNHQQHLNEVNEIRAERLVHTANLLALVAQQQPTYHPQNHPNYHTQNSSTRSEQAATRNRGKALVNSSAPIYDQEPATCYNCKEYGHVSRECHKPKQAKDAAYHKEKLLLCKQEEARVQLNAKQADWKDDTDEEYDDQELKAHYMYIAQIQEVTPDVADISGPIFNAEPLQKEHDDQDDTDEPAQERDLLASLIKKIKCEINDRKNRNKLLESSNKALVDKLEDLKKFQAKLDRYHDVNYASKELFAHQETISLMSQQKEARIKFCKTRKDKEIDKVITLENKVKVLDDIVYKTGQSVQTMNMLNHNYKMSFAKPEFLKKAQRANPHLLNAKTSNVNFVCVTCGKCVLNDNHDMYVLNYINDVNSRTIQPIAMPVSTKEPKRTVNQSVATSHKKTVSTKSTVKKPRNVIRKIYEQVSKTCSWWYPKFTPSGYKWKPKFPIGNVNLNVSMPLGNASRTTNILELITHRHETSTARTPEQNGVVDRRNRTLVEAARTMLSAVKVPLFFWAEAIATTSFTQNRSLVIPRHEKTPYHIINGRKPSVKFFHIFASLCYIVRVGENLNKIKEKGDACIFVGYSTQSRSYRVFNKRTRVIAETIHVNFDELHLMASDHVTETITTPNELDLLFSPMFDELLNGTATVVSNTSAVNAADAPDKRQQQNTTQSTTTTIAADISLLNIQTTPVTTNQSPTHVPTVTATKNINQA